jgi:hypothetical protein
VGAGRGSVRRAVAYLERRGGPEAVLREAARSGALARVRYTERLALEMALHEEAERRAIEGELAPLAAAWRDAEEIAAIADDLLLPASVRRRLARLKGDGAAD